jgi:hypothetical protein
MDNLETVVEKLNLQKSQKADYVVPASSLIMGEDQGLMFVGGSGLYRPNDIMHQGFSEKLDIPMGYYRRMMGQNPTLLAENINSWLRKADKKGFLVRTFETPEQNIARAFLSDRYGIIDNYDILFAALDAIRKTGIHVEIKEAAVTDRKLYLYVTAPEIEVQAEALLQKYVVPGRHEFSANLGVISGMVITNSEVGQGRYSIAPMATILKCWNGAIARDEAFNKQHLGVRLDQGVVNWSKETEQKNLSLVISQTKDAVNTFLSKEYLSGMVKRLTEFAGKDLDRPVDTVQAVTKELGRRIVLSPEQEQNILNHFIRGGDTAATGIFQAITFEAQKMSPDSRFEAQTFAWDILPKVAQIDQTQKN